MKFLKKYEALFMYLIIFVFIPFLFVNNIKDDPSYDFWATYLSIYVIFIAPLLFVIPYKLSKLATKKEKFYYTLFGLVIPFAIIYYYIYLDYLENFHPGF